MIRAVELAAQVPALEGFEAHRIVRRKDRGIERAGLPCRVHIGVGDFAHVIAHYANALGATQVCVTETERAEGSALGDAVAAMTEHTQVPVSIVR